MNRKAFLTAVIAGAVAVAWNQPVWSAESEFADIKTEVTKRHDESVKRLQEWIHQISIAAENRGYPEGPDHLMSILRDAGFDQISKVPTDGKPGVFATLDAAAKKRSASISCTT